MILLFRVSINSNFALSKSPIYSLSKKVVYLRVLDMVVGANTIAVKLLEIIAVLLATLTYSSHWQRLFCLRQDDC